MKNQSIKKRAIISIMLALSATCALAVVTSINWYPEGNAPRPGDQESRSLQKINDLLYQMVLINSASQYVTLTDAATVVWTVNSANGVQNAVVTLGGSRTLSIVGATSGMTGVLIVVQDNSGNRTLTLPAGSKVIAGGSGAITLTTTGNAIDVLTWSYNGTNYYWNYGKNYN